MPDDDLYCRRKAVAAVNHIADMPLDWLWRVQYWTANQYNIKLAQALEPDYHWVTRLEVDVHILGPAALAKMAKSVGATPEAVGLYHCPGGRCYIAVLGGRRKGQGVMAHPRSWLSGRPGTSWQTPARCTWAITKPTFTARPSDGREDEGPCFHG